MNRRRTGSAEKARSLSSGTREAIWWVSGARVRLVVGVLVHERAIYLLPPGTTSEPRMKSTAYGII